MWEQLSWSCLSHTDDTVQCGAGLPAKGPWQSLKHQPANNQTPVAADAAPASRTSGAAACGSTRTTP